MPELQADGTYIERHEELPSEEIKRRLAEKAALIKELEDRRPKPEPVPTPASEPEIPMYGHTYTVDGLKENLTGRITADGRKLAGLATRAKKLEAIAEAASEKANTAKIAANTARSELNAYMFEHGLK